MEKDHEDIAIEEEWDPDSWSLPLGWGLLIAFIDITGACIWAIISEVPTF